MIVVACEPLFPPLLMISGTNSATIAARWISASKKPMAVAVSISPKNRTDSHPPRLRSMRDEARPRSTARSAPRVPPIFWMSSVASSSATSARSSAVIDAQEPASVIDDRKRKIAVAPKHARDLLLIHRDRHRHHVGCA